MPASLSRDSKPIVLGRFGRPHGIKGWLRLVSFTAPPENILNYARLDAHVDGGWLSLEIDRHLRQSREYLIHLKGVDDPQAARRFTGVEVSVASERLPALAAGSYYWHELQGMEVANLRGELFGKVAGLMETGANDVLIVAPTTAGIDQRERLIPWRPDVVVCKVDTVKRKITVDWEADWLE